MRGSFAVGRFRRAHENATRSDNRHMFPRNIVAVDSESEYQCVLQFARKQSAFAGRSRNKGKNE